jgi:dsRNA-specific ribonuclease
MDNPNNKLITKQEVEDILNYFWSIGDNNERLQITNLENFQRAFVHESYYQSVQNAIINAQIDEKKTFLSYIPSQSNERLEYLGDSILKGVMGRYLYERFGEEREGFMTKLKIKIEKCSMLHKFGLTLGFRKHLLLSLQVENQTILDIFRGRSTPSYYEDAFEAFIGSILIEYGERGYLYADRFVRSVIENVIDFSELISQNDNFKDSLQRYFQSLKFRTPVYIALDETGPVYRRVFARMLTVTEEQLCQFKPVYQAKIRDYTSKVLKEYRNSNATLFKKLVSRQQQGEYILGVGFERKVVSSEQMCAKQCMINLGLPQDY